MSSICECLVHVLYVQVGTIHIHKSHISSENCIHLYIMGQCYRSAPGMSASVSTTCRSTEPEAISLFACCEPVTVP